ncbi:MAG TPA: hypothetical protein VFK15_05860 [Burkholderiales bacterium]|nr:hypothetical protein [Burkholderiales bacterium]
MMIGEARGTIQLDTGNAERIFRQLSDAFRRLGEAVGAALVDGLMPGRGAVRAMLAERDAERRAEAMAYLDRRFAGTRRRQARQQNRRRN